MIKRKSRFKLPQIRLRLITWIFLFLAAIALPTVIKNTFFPTGIEAGWWDEGWIYRQRIPITYSGSSNLTEYQVLVDGLDTATLISAGKIQSDCDDLRFTNQGGNLLEYSIVGNTCNTADTKIWVKTDSIPGGDIDIYLYYGNSNANSYQSESKTFSYESEKTVGYVLDVSTNDLQIISLEGGNSITHNSVTKTLGQYETDSFTSIDQWGAIAATKLFNAEDQYSNTDLFVPVSWAGTEFVFNSRYNGTNNFYIIAPWQNATVDFFDDGVEVCSDQAVTSSGATINCAVVGAVRIVSDYPILIFHRPTGDNMPLRPSSTDKWLGGGSESIITSNASGADYRYIYDTIASEINNTDLGADASVGLAGDSGFGGGAILAWSADNPIGVLQQGDGDGGDGHFFNQETEQGTRFGSASQADYISVASTQAATCSVYEASDNSLVGTGTATSSNTSVYFLGFGTGDTNTYTTGAWYMECDLPVVAHWQKATDSESNLMHYPMMRQFTYPTPAVGSPATEEVTPGPVAYWKFDEGYGTTANSTINSSHTGTLNGGVIWRSEEDCVSGKCIELDGTNDWVQFNGDLNISGAMTLSFWFKTPDKDENHYFFDNRNPGSWWFIKDYTGTNCAGYNGEICFHDRLIGQDSEWDINEWNHVVITDDTSTAKMYINGKLVDTGSGESTTLTTNFRLGTRYTNTGYFKGLFDEIKIYPYARNADQVKQDFNALGGPAAGAVLGAQEQVFMSEGLVGYWKMDDTGIDAEGEISTDSSGNGNDATLYGDNSTGDNGTGMDCTTSGKFGTACDFDGTDDYISVIDPSDGSLDFGSDGDFSISTWVKGAGGVADQQTVVSKGDAGSNPRYLLKIMDDTDDTFRATVTVNGTNSDCDGTTDILDNNWHHIVISVDRDGKLVGYVDGIQECSVGSSNDQNIDTSVDFNIGRSWDGSTARRPFNGKIDETRIYNRALSSSEITALHNWAPGPVGYWPMDEGTGTSTIYDRSGNSNNGTMTGSMTESDWVSGKVGGALDFDGSDDYVAASSSTDFDMINNLTVSTWVNPAAVDNHVSFVSTNSAGTGFQLGARSDGKLWFTTYSVLDYITTSSYLTANEWQYITAVMDSDNDVSFYVNGIFKEKVTHTTPANSNTSGGIQLGRYSGSYYFNGLIDEVKVYNYARTPAQIQQDMGGVGGSILGSSTLPNPIAHWRLDEGYGTTTNDSIGNVTGTITGADWSNSGKYNKALDFEEDNSDIVSFSGSLSSDDISVSAWINAESWDSGGGNYDSIVIGTSAFSFRNSGGNIEFIVNTSAWTGYGGFSTDDIPTSEWHHLTATFDGDKTRIYLDGVLKSTREATDGTLGALGTVKIGDGLSAGRYFDGLIDEVKIYNTALNAQQVKLDMNAGSSLKYSVGNSTADDITDGAGNPPVAEWNFDEKTGTSANDISGNGNTGTLTNSPAWTIGKIGSALEFNGGNYVSIPGPATELQITGAITLESWVKTSYTSDYQIIIDDLGSSPYTSWSQWINNTGKVTWYDGGVWRDSATTITDGNWHHIVTVVDASDNLSFYIDGQKDANTYSSISARTATSDAKAIGVRADASTYFLNGLIDEVKVYNYARTPAQISYDYNGGLPIAHWRMDECQGTTINDGSGNGNSGTLTVGGSGTQTSAGTCDTASTAWGNGASGKFSSSLSFDGTDDYVDYGDVHDMGTSDWSTSAWFKTSSATGAIVGKSLYGSLSGRWSIIYDSGDLIVIFEGDSSTVNVQATGSWNDSQWHFITATFDRDGDLTVYIDGKYINSSSISANSSTDMQNSCPLYVGAYQDNTCTGRQAGFFFNGQIDDVRLYNYTLSPNQVKNIMNENASVRFGD